ncbi:hypothetical protein [Dethiobacter alkaliphilus]|uniref:hypothetical protein n=1 Tax=Dethiobacter alkaliphilus TaxID=427926 RepID=UPI002226EE54|nr:hypothetical protein [Dethiobacter alkaliphilus]MCW3490443.1 hypothetical protein [Dethiobacter alkaliphilus]
MHKVQSMHPLSRLLVAGIILFFSFILCYELPYTESYFYTSIATKSINICTTSFNNNFSLSPGDCLTNNSPNDPTENTFLIAQIIDNRLRLDFGTYPFNNSRKFNNVLVIENLTNKNQEINWHFCPKLSGLFETRNNSFTISPYSHRQMDFKLERTKSSRSGTHTGTLYISALNGFLSMEVPVVIRLSETSETSTPSAEEDTVPDQLTPINDNPI